MEVWPLTFISVTLLATLTKYMFNDRKDQNKKFLLNTFAPSLTLGILFASFTSLVVFLFN